MAYLRSGVYLTAIYPFFACLINSGVDASGVNDQLRYFSGGYYMTTFAKTALDNALLRYAIGLNTDFFERQATDQSTFPPHDVEEMGEGIYKLTLAVAGFTEDEIDIVSHNDVLTISGRKDDHNKERKLLYRGIAFRDFSRQFKIGDHVHVVDATLKHGLLIVNLVRQIPENLKPKQILLSRI